MGCAQKATNFFQIQHRSAFFPSVYVGADFRGRLGWHAIGVNVERVWGDFDLRDSEVERRKLVWIQLGLVVTCQFLSYSYSYYKFSYTYIIYMDSIAFSVGCPRFQSSYYIMFCVSLIYHYFRNIAFQLPSSLTNNNNTVCITCTRKNITKKDLSRLHFCKRYDIFHLMCQFLNFVKRPSYWYHTSHYYITCALSCIHVCFLKRICF